MYTPSRSSHFLVHLIFVVTVAVAGAAALRPLLVDSHQAANAAEPVASEVHIRTETERSLMGGFYRASTVTVEQRKITLDDVHTGSLLLYTDAPGTYLEAMRLDTRVDMGVTGLLSRVTVTQTFSNTTDEWSEGVYAFPLPEGAAVDVLRMKIGEHVIEGRIMEKDLAKKTYVQAKDNGQRASLVEQDRPNLFRTSVANIAPRSTVEVQISYLDMLRYDDGQMSLRFPLAVTPRFSPSQLSGGMLPSATPVSTAGQAATPNGLAEVVVRLNAGFPIKAINSESHAISVASRGPYREVAFENVAVPMDRDFTLSWTPEVGAEPGAAVFTEEYNGETYALVMFLPPQTKTDPRRLPRETVIVLDTSGSMAGESFDQARAAVEDALAKLHPDDYFNLIEFNSQHTALFDQPRPASRANLKDAQLFLLKLRANGGTNMAPALAQALDAAATSGRLRQVIFVTDGAVDNERELFGLIESGLGETRLFTVGIGSAPNTFFMRRAAQSGRGTYRYIGSVRQVRAEMSALFSKLEAPVLRDVEVRWPGKVAEVWPPRTPDLYQGEPLMLTARLSELPRTIAIEGEQVGARWSRTIPLDRTESFRGVSTLWARSKVASLMDGLSRGELPGVVRSRVLPLALEHRLVTRYTSLVAVDDRPVRPLSASLRATPAVHRTPMGGQVPYPAGATGWPLQVMLGLGLLGLALGCTRMQVSR
ncbi:MAG: marine proteobacterial sortase target protein [Pseudomonadota bacterium]